LDQAIEDLDGGLERVEWTVKQLVSDFASFLYASHRAEHPVTGVLLLFEQMTRICLIFVQPLQTIPNWMQFYQLAENQTHMPAKGVDGRFLTFTFMLIHANPDNNKWSCCKFLASWLLVIAAR
jgi:hypothetical protein